MAEIHKMFMYHLDNIRIQKNIKIKCFCDGVCSDRHYRRLINGEQNVSEEKIIQFCNKLNISPSDFFYSFNEKNRYEYKKLQNLYQMLVNNDLDSFKIHSKKLQTYRFMNLQDERFFKYLNLKYASLLKLEQRQYLINQLSSICDYPSCSKNDAFDFIDIISLLLISEIQVEHGNEDALNLLKRILFDPEIKYINSDSRHILPSVFGSTAIMLSRLNHYDDSLIMAKKGIKYSLKYSDNNSLSHLYYIQSISQLRLGKRKKAEISASRCLFNTLVRDNEEEYKVFFTALKKDFNCNPLTFIRHFDTIQ